MTSRAQLDRHRSAALRAVGRDPQAELRSGRLTGRGGHVDVASPYLGLADTQDPAVSRGVADALGLLLRHHDSELHARVRPDNALERIIFDQLEQLRCQSLAPDLAGIRSNLAQVSDAWCQQARSDGVAESGVGLLVYTTIHMVRARLGLGMTDEEVDSIIEGSRARLGRLVGHALKQLRLHQHDQAAYASAAAEIARLVADMAADAGIRDAADDASRYRMLVPPDWSDDAPDDDRATGGAAPVATGDEAERTVLEALGGYEIWDRQFDVEVHGADLYPAAMRTRARSELDDVVRHQSVSAQRIAERLRRLFGIVTPDEWRFGVDEGVIDARRLPQLVAKIDAREVFRRPEPVLRSDTAVTLLLDNSGSMKAQRYEKLAVLADTLSRAMDLAGVTNEVLGHTTASWTGGQPMKDWKEAGQPANPGRIAELAHVVYKDADASWRRSRGSLAAMNITHHFRESVDGEAVIWAHQRLLARPEARRILVVISDGAPGEAATTKANGREYLGDHLMRVVDQIERRSPIEIAALTVDQSVDMVFRRSIPIDLDATLTVGAYASLERLFRP